MTDPHVRRAEAADLATLVRLRDAAARWMLARGVTGQWRPGELGEDHFRRVMTHGEVWLAESGGRPVGAWELWWQDEAAWGPQPPSPGTSTAWRSTAPPPAPARAATSSAPPNTGRPRRAAPWSASTAWRPTAA